MSNTEKEFMEAFEIKGKLLTCQETDCKKSLSSMLVCEKGKHFTCEKIVKVYPSITSEIVLKLLELVLIRDKYAFYFNRSNGKFVFQENINTFTECRKKFYQDYKLKHAVLKACIQLKSEIQESVKELFNEQ